MRAPRRVRTLCVSLLCVAAVGVANAADVPRLTGRVVDRAALLSGDQRAALEQKLADFEQRTGDQVAVLTIDSLEGDSIEAFTMKVAEQWKLGSKERNNGVLLTIAKDDRKMRIEVGYGLEAKLTDALSGRILDNVVRPQFRSGDFPGGIEQGVDAILGTLSGDASAVPERPASPSITSAPLPPRLVGFGVYALVVGIFSIAGLFSKGGEAWFLYFFLMPFHLLFPLILSPWLGPAMFGLWALGFPLFRLWMKLTGRIDRYFPKFDGSGWRNLSSMSGGSWSGGSGGGSWSSGGSSGGGFSGGGGSFGGGGSSSGW
jgi:uncharacterized protein